MEVINKAELLKSKEQYTFDDLCEIMSLLRSDTGCPWDREQTHESIRKNFIEETYEVCEAIDEKSPEHLCEELGDVMLQVVFHTEMEKENGNFDINDVISGICKKLVRRHPHIFSDTVAETPDKVLTNWDAIKREEKGQKNLYEELSSVSKTLPSLMRMQKLVKKAGKQGVIVCPDDEVFASLDKDGYAELLIKVCSSANKNGYDLEEILEEKCNNVVKKAKKL